MTNAILSSSEKSLSSSSLEFRGIHFASLIQLLQLVDGYLMALFKMLEFDAMIIDQVVCLDGAGSHYSSANQSM